MYFVILLTVFIYSLLNLDNMDKIKEWFNLNKTILLIAVAIILLIGLFIFGFMWGKTNAELKAANEKEKIIKTESRKCNGKLCKGELREISKFRMKKKKVINIC